MSQATTFYDLSAESTSKGSFNFDELKGKVVLVVNLASKCGFTPQYTALQELYNKYKDQGFIIIGFPCNQFGSQEPGSDEEIATFCSVNYGVEFPVMKKIEVNGDNTHPVYKWLKNEKSGLLGLTRVKWNFEKFLINKKGEVANRYASTTKPESLGPEIEKLLKEDA